MQALIDIHLQKIVDSICNSMTSFLLHLAIFNYTLYSLFNRLLSCLVTKSLASIYISNYLYLNHDLAFYH